MKFYFLRSILLIFSIVFGSLLHAQTPGSKFSFVKDEVVHNLDCYKDGMCQKIIIPDEYEAACVLALSYYPELQDKNIEFVYGKGSYSMAARPVPLSLFKKKKNRKYRIFINTHSKNQGLLLPDVGFNAQVGIVGHELAHILYYTNKSSLRIILDGIGYASKKYRAKFEKETDRVAIERGLGWQLYEFSNSTQMDKDVPEVYKIYKTQIYMCPQSILNYIATQEKNGAINKD